MHPIVGILLVLCSAVSVRATYSVHFVDHRCREGNDTVVYELDSEVSIILEANDVVPYEPNKNCTIIIQPPSNYGVVLAIRKIDFISSASPNEDEDHLKVYHSGPFSPTKLYRFKFDLYEKLSYSSDGSMMLLYHTESRDYRRYLELGFEVTATAFTADKLECEGKFRCGNQNCIENILVCDNHNNCGDSSDESKSMCEKYRMPDISDNYVIVMGMCLLAMVLLLSYTVYSIRRNAWLLNSPERATREPCAAPYDAVYPSSCPSSKNSSDPKLYGPQQSSVFDGGVVNPYYESKIPNEDLPSKPPPYEP